MLFKNRKIKQDRYGYWIGYIGRMRVYNFATGDMKAAYWKLTGLLDNYEPYSSEWCERCLNELENTK